MYFFLQDLLELLDQVENAISIEGPPLDGHQIHSPGICNILSDEKPVKAISRGNRVAIKAQKEADIGFVDPYFLVLEVCFQAISASIFSMLLLEPPFRNLMFFAWICFW